MTICQLFSRVNKSHLILLAVFVASLLIRLWLLDKRWINVDEGAHLMDGVLALDGKIPQVDFASRSPIYVYAIAGSLKLFYQLHFRASSVSNLLLAGWNCGLSFGKSPVRSKSGASVIRDVLDVAIGANAICCSEDRTFSCATDMPGRLCRCQVFGA